MEKNRALIIEDDKALRVIYIRLLSNAGYEVIEAINGSEALDILENNTPRLIFLDMLLPFVNGAEVIDYITSNAERFEKTHVAIISSNNDFEPLAHNVPWGQFVLKPILPDQIREIAHYAATVRSY